jgi:flagellar M-ring protein FliF
MEEIKKNLLALWKGLSPQRRVSLIGSFLLSLAVLSAVVYFASKPRLTLLYGGLAPAEAGKVTEYLDQKKITYNVTDGGRAIEVPAQDVYAARMGLAAEGIPTQSDSGVGFELFDKPTFGESDFMQRANYYRALQGELARTIKQLDEVQNARVLIVVPEDKLFGQDHQDAKASVFVQLQPGRMLSTSQLQAIRFLVANGVEGLQPERVAVIDSNGRAMADSDTGSLATDGQVTDKQRQARADLEQYLEQKAQSMLDQVLGPGQAVVRVASEIDYSQLQETSERYDPKNSAIKTETSTTESNTTQSSSGGNGAGVAANSSAPAPTDGSGKTNDEKKENVSNTYEVSKTVDTKSIGAGAIKRLTIALMLNERKTPSGTGANATSKPTPRTPQEIAELENLVKAAVGFTSNDVRQDTIATSEVPFADLFDDTAPVAKKDNLMQQVSGYLPYVTQGCLVLLAIGILLYFKSSMTGGSRKGASEADPDSFEMLLNNYTIQANGNGYGGHGPANGHAAGRPNGANGHGVAILTPVELSRLIRENPDNASQAIKAWLRRN